MLKIDSLLETRMDVTQYQQISQRDAGQDELLSKISQDIISPQDPAFKNYLPKSIPLDNGEVVLYAPRENITFHAVMDLKASLKTSMKNITVSFSKRENRFIDSYRTTELFTTSFFDLPMLTDELVASCLESDYKRRDWSVIWGMLEIQRQKSRWPFKVTNLNGSFKYVMNRLLETALIITYKNDVSQTLSELYSMISKTLDDGNLYELILTSFPHVENPLGGHIVDLGELAGEDDDEDEEEKEGRELIMQTGDIETRNMLEMNPPKKPLINRARYISIVNAERQYKDRSVNYNAVTVARLLNKRKIDNYPEPGLAAAAAFRIYKGIGMSDVEVLKHIISYLVPLSKDMKSAVSDIENADLLQFEESTQKVWLGEAYKLTDKVIIYTYKKDEYSKRIRFTNGSEISRSVPFYKSLTFHFQDAEFLKLDLLSFCAVDAEITPSILLYSLIEKKISDHTKKIMKYLKIDPNELPDSFYEKYVDSTKTVIYLDRLHEYFQKQIDHILRTGEERIEKIEIHGVLYRWNSDKNKLELLDEEASSQSTNLVTYINKYSDMISSFRPSFPVKFLLDDFTEERSLLIERIRRLVIKDFNKNPTPIETYVEALIFHPIYTKLPKFYEKFFKKDEFNVEKMDFWTTPSVPPTTDINDVLEKPHKDSVYFVEKIDGQGHLFYEGKVYEMNKFTEVKPYTEFFFNTGLNRNVEFNVDSYPVQVVAAYIHQREDVNAFLSIVNDLRKFYNVEDTIIVFKKGSEVMRKWAAEFIKKFKRPVNRGEAYPKPSFDVATIDYSESEGDFYLTKSSKELLMYYTRGYFSGKTMETFLGVLDKIMVDFRIVNCIDPITQDFYYRFLASSRAGDKNEEYSTYRELLEKKHGVSIDQHFKESVTLSTADPMDLDTTYKNNILAQRPIISDWLYKIKGYDIQGYKTDWSLFENIEFGMKIRAVQAQIKSEKWTTIIANGDISNTGLINLGDKLWVEVDQYKEIKDRYY